MAARYSDESTAGVGHHSVITLDVLDLDLELYLSYHLIFMSPDHPR